MKFYPRKYKDYIGHFEEKALFEKIKHVAGVAGSTLIYYVLILYVLLADKGIPAKSKVIIVAALGYFILPTDLVADILPGLGFTDDIAFLTYAICTLSEHLTPEVKEEAMNRLNGKKTVSSTENRL